MLSKRLDDGVLIQVTQADSYGGLDIDGRPNRNVLHSNSNCTFYRTIFLENHLEERVGPWIALASHAHLHKIKKILELSDTEAEFEEWLRVLLYE